MASYEPNLEADTSDIKRARAWAISIICSIFSVKMYKAELLKIFTETHLKTNNIEFLILFTELSVLIFIWIWATGKELGICFAWLDPQRFQPPSSFKETIMITSIGVSLAVLVCTARNIYIFGIIYTIYNLYLTYTNQYAIKEISRAITDSRMNLNADKEIDKDLYIQYDKALEEIEVYYDKKTQLKRSLFIDLFCIFGLAFGILGEITKYDLYNQIAYAIFILTILFSELSIMFWRIKRDDELRAAKEEINWIKKKKGNFKPNIANAKTGFAQ